MGQLESPSIWNFEYRKNPAKHVVLLRILLKDRDPFARQMNSLLARQAEKRVLIFVHGFNVSFEDAARRSAQLHYDLGFQGASAFFSWPSVGKASAYTVDEAASEWAIPHFVEFVDFVSKQTNAESIYIVAHSMGNRVVTRSLMDLAQNDRHGKIREIILAAPDIDAGTFDQFAPKMSEPFSRITLYASSNDRALFLSRQVHAAPRAGEVVNMLPAIQSCEKIDIIDASVVDTSLLGHSYYGDRTSVISDMFYVLKGGHPVDGRFGLEKAPYGQGSHFWRFKPASN